MDYTSLYLYKVVFFYLNHSAMNQKNMLSVLGKVAIVVAGVLAADLLKQGLAKAKLSRPLSVKEEE